MRIVVAGGTGFVGRVVVKHLLNKGHQVVVLTRNVASAILVLGDGCEFQYWNTELEDAPLDKIGAFDSVINLMGENIAAKRWTEAQKEKILLSRTKGTQRLINGIKLATAAGNKKLKSFVSTSAIGVYGDRGDEEIGESSEISNKDFLSLVCSEWEKSAKTAKEFCERVVIIRVGIVIGRAGGALSKMLPLFKNNLGGFLGSGKQYMSWIHIDDLAELYCTAMEDDRYKDEINGTAPRPVTNQVFTNTLAKVLKKWAILPTPAFALNLALGEMSTMILTGQKVIPKKAMHYHFDYQYPLLEKALKEVI
ncbi:MAG: TIGR01777 family oxidoreductase [Bacteriovoracaceae bacterium]|nr:TIGR01777 family oxidoreductase [Bacteriovoracaceae bacterium]